MGLLGFYTSIHVLVGLWFNEWKPSSEGSQTSKKKRHFPKEESNEARKDRHWLGSMVFWYLFKLAEWGTVWFTTLAWMLVCCGVLAMVAMFSMVQARRWRDPCRSGNRFPSNRWDFDQSLQVSSQFSWYFGVVSQLIWFRTTPLFLGFPWTRSHFTFTILYLLTLEVMKNHEKLAPGMFYGLNFPWTEEMLLSSKFGAEWLTQAMHVAGTLSQAKGWRVGGLRVNG